MNNAGMLVLRLILVFTIPAYLTIDTVEGIVYITGYVGETIKLISSQADVFHKELRELSWMYPCQNECSGKSTYVNVATCYLGYWEYLSYGHNLVGNNDACENGLAYMRATEPGNFTYKCQEMSEDQIDVIREVTCMITINTLDNSSMSPCLAKYVPSSQNLIFDFICRNYHQRDCLNKEKCDNVVFIQHNGVRIISNITSANKIVARIGLENISSISQYYCINQNHLSPCVVDTVTLSNPIAITPIVNRVKEGSDAIFECSFKGEREKGFNTNQWMLSRHIKLSRVQLSGTFYSTFKILEVKSEYDGVVVTCVVDINDTLFYSEAVLEILTGNDTSTSSTELGSVRTSLTTDDATTIPFQVPIATNVQLFNHTTASTSKGLDSCKLLMMCFLIPVFGVLLIAALMVLAVYCWTRDIPGRPSADATYEVVEI